MQSIQQPRTIWNFFQRESGRKFVFFAASATTVGLFLGNFLPHTFGLEYYKDFVQCYHNGIPRPVPEKIKKRLEQSMDKLQLQAYERKLIKPFTVFGFDLFLAGSTKHRWGCALGIPVNYNYEQEHELKLQEIRFRNEQIDWNSEHGKLLKQAILLSEDEQIFGFCKSLLQLQTHRVLMNALFPSISFMSMYAVGSYLNQKLLLLARPLSLRLIMYSILGFFAMGSCTFMKDYNQVCYDADIDKKLATLGPELVAAGVSFYDKTLKKNMALRALIGDDTYTSKGNENYYFRQKSLPLTIRKSFFEQKWQELKAPNETAEFAQ